LARRGPITEKGAKLVTTSMPMRDICAAANVPHTMRAGWLLGIIM